MTRNLYAFDNCRPLIPNVGHLKHWGQYKLEPDRHGSHRHMTVCFHIINNYYPSYLDDSAQCLWYLYQTYTEAYHSLSGINKFYIWLSIWCQLTSKIFKRRFTIPNLGLSCVPCKSERDSSDPFTGSGIILLRLPTFAEEWALWRLILW